jgi:hypothetical protein
MAAAFVQPGGEAVAGDLGKGNGADLVALAVQADRAGAGGDRDVPGVESCAFFLAGSGVEQDGEDGGIAGAAAGGGSFGGALLGGVRASGSPGRGTRARLTVTRRPAWSYSRVTAARAWLIEAGDALSRMRWRRQAVTAASAPTVSANASGWPAVREVSQLTYAMVCRR